MNRLARSSWLVVILVLFKYQMVCAQLPVIDVSNLSQNIIQATQSVLMVVHMVEELLPLGEIVVNDTFSSDLNDLAGIVREAQGLSYDLASLNSQIATLFDLNTAPRGSLELQQRLAAIRKVVFDSYVYALRTQTLIKTALSAVRHLTRLIAAVGDLAGNMQSNQTLIQLEGKLNQSLATLQVQTAAYERAQSVERLTDVLTRESAQRIDEAIMADWPK